MARWIDADKLKEKYTMVIKRYKGGIMERPAVLLETIDEAPSIDIVRCSECRNYYNQYGDSTCLLHTDWSVNADDFCSYGEREGE